MRRQGDESDQCQDLAPLLTAAAAGSPGAWQELVTRYSHRVFALAKSRCRNDDVAEEITQSVFATIATKLGAGEYTEKGRFESWLFRVAMNRVRDQVRRNKRRPASAESGALDAQCATPSAGRAELDSFHSLRTAMQALSDVDREIIELRHHGGLSFKQMAEALDEPVGTLLARHHRALRKLRDALESASMIPSGEAHV